MKIALPSAAWRWTVLFASLVIAALIISEAGVLWLAGHRLDSQKIAQMERGVALTPGDGDAWDRLGRMRQWDFLNSDIPGAINDYWKAVRYDPRSAHFWIDLAAAYEANGDDAHAREAYLQAMKAYPASGEVAFHYGNFLLREQEYPAAFAELRKSVAADPSLLPLAISRTWRSTEDVDQLLDNVLPANQEAYLDALNFFASIHEPDAGLATWQRLIALGRPLSLPRVSAFFDDLIHEDRADDAKTAWVEALAAAGLPHAEPANHNLIWNGKFERDFTNEGLDWRWTPLLTDALMGFDPDPGPNGSRAVRIDFSGGTNLTVQEPAQYVPVQPGQNYHLHVYMRTEAISTESGMRFLVTDPNHANALNVTTTDFTESHPWTAAETDFSTGPDTHFVRVQLFRSPSRLFENKLEGTVWIADVALTQTANQAGHSSP
jgi:tetratricopeptide (TPR) repeat protein